MCVRACVRACVCDTHTIMPTPDLLAVEDPVITCIDFNDGQVTASNGLHVFNDGVVVGNYSQCADGMCAYFNGSARMELPYFSNAYDHFKQFKVAFTFWREGGNTNDQAFVSNDCLDNKLKEAGNSLVLASSGNVLVGGFRDPSGYYPVITGGMTDFPQIPTKSTEWPHIPIPVSGGATDVSH